MLSCCMLCCSAVLAACCVSSLFLPYCLIPQSTSLGWHGFNQVQCDNTRKSLLNKVGKENNEKHTFLRPTPPFAHLCR
uniref:Secreted protein n=1 Tax=Anguilla anguilla TaxID=7936 RepID=A0A0E9X6C1_ANGAN